MKKCVLAVLFLVATLSFLSMNGCELTDASDELLSLLNIEIDHNFEYYDSETDKTVQGHIQISGDDVSYSDSEGNSGSGTLDNETFTAEFFGPEESGTITIEFENMYEDYSGIIEFSDGRVITISSND